MTKGTQPTQLSTQPVVVRKQRKLVRMIRDRRGEVIISCHTQTCVNRFQILQIARAIRSRGADFAKIVVHTFNMDDVAELLKTSLELKKSIDLPFTLMNVEYYDKLDRLLSLLFGSAWVYCRTSDGRGFPGQPTVEEARTFLEFARIAKAGMSGRSEQSDKY